eukprot:TRINITY_DN757_c0_g1_i1.p1 TRINITY_DN757_c0_g1~~TRINITY_DN757_c0_g1_i1.p1  ORF type:complete len:201 (-),score=84.16 TRINITY_DN757_c0_g1_i1:46-627(-)
MKQTLFIFALLSFTLLVALTRADEFTCDAHALGKDNVECAKIKAAEAAHYGKEAAKDAAADAAAAGGSVLKDATIYVAKTGASAVKNVAVGIAGASATVVKAGVSMIVYKFFSSGNEAFDGACELCVELVKTAEEIVTEESTLDHTKTFLNLVCRLADDSDKCKMSQANLENLKVRLVKDEDPATICKDLTIC